ncbi:MAG: lytic transglycosylase domain-containing protein [Deltaproteobacteria bacterium]|jgi:hypothetical protein|nr:lytic transglycosylase domain-containing protein [Deltaproteobacteria bacterium]
MARPGNQFQLTLVLLILCSFFAIFSLPLEAQISFAPQEAQENPASQEDDPESQVFTDEGTLPYWEKPKESEEPYWVPKPQNLRPYWEPEPGSQNAEGEDSPLPTEDALGSSPEAQASGLFAPPPPPPPPPQPKAKATPKKKAKDPEVVVEELSFYMFKDENGVTYMTDAPVDPRYRLVKVEITVSKGLAPFRRLNLDSIMPYILAASERYMLDPALIASIIKAESAFDPKAVSWAGARGLMQLMPRTAAQMGVVNSFDPQQNIMGGSRYLRLMLNRFNGNLTLAIAAYNCGPERVAKVMRVPDIAETRNYVKTVFKNLSIMAPLFPEWNRH